VVILPMLLLGIIQAIYRQDLSMLLRSVVVNVPLALLLTAVAVKLVQLGLAVTDELSSAVAHGAGLDTGHFMAAVTTALSNGSAGGPGVPAFIVFLGAIAVVVGTFLVWIELLIRAAAVYVAVLFLPLALASLAWPAIAHWCRRLVDTLVALILGKFVIVSVLSLAAGALNAGSGAQGSGSFSAVLGGAALLLLAGLAPWALFRLLPFMEAGAVAHLEGVSQRARQAAKVPSRGLAQTALRAAATSAVGGPSGLVVGVAGAARGPGSDGAAASGTGVNHEPGPTVSGLGPQRRRSAGRAAPWSSGSRPALGWSGRQGATATGAGPGAVSLVGPVAGIPRWEPDSEMIGAVQRWQLDEPMSVVKGREVEGDGWGGTPPATSAVGVSIPLPRQSGVALVDGLGHDELGVRLVSRPPSPSLPRGGRSDG
jgi:hypothetical protein